MTDWSKPTTASDYTNYTDESNARDVSLAKQFNSATVSDTNLPTGTIRWNNSNYNWDIWSGSAWGALATTYGISISGNAATSSSCSGNAATSSSCSGNAATSSSCSGNAATSSSCSGNAATATTASALVTANNYQMNQLGVGTAPGGTAGEVRATGNVIAYYSDERLKDILGPIENALDAVRSLRGVRYKANALAREFGFTSTREEVGVLAQDVQLVLPQVLNPAPFDIAQNEEGADYSKSGENYLTVDYPRLVALLIEAVKELTIKVDKLETR